MDAVPGEGPRSHTVFDVRRFEPSASLIRGARSPLPPLDPTRQCGDTCPSRWLGWRETTGKGLADRDIDGRQVNVATREKIRLSRAGDDAPLHRVPARRQPAS